MILMDGQLILQYEEQNSIGLVRCVLDTSVQVYVQVIEQKFGWLDVELIKY